MAAQASLTLHPCVAARSRIFLAPVLMALMGIMIPLAAMAAPAAAQEQEEQTQKPAEQTEEAAPEEAAVVPDKALSFFSTSTVTATGYKVDTFTIPTPVIVFDAEEIQRRAPNSAVDLLRDEPGVDVNGIGPKQIYPIIRGQRGLRILYLEDGLRVNNARRQTDFGEVTSLTDINSVETVEVVRGAASVLYGSDAIGGVVNLITKVPPYAPGTSFGGWLGLRYSTADEQQKGTAGISGNSDNLSYSLGITYRDANEYEAPAGDFGGITLADDTTVEDTGIQDDSVHGRLGYRFDDRHSVFFRVSRYRSDEAGFGFVDPELYDPDEPSRVRITYPYQNFDRYQLGYSASALQSPLATTIDFQLYRQENERDLVNDVFVDIGPIFGPGSSFELQVVSTGYTDVETTGFRGEVTKVLAEKHLLTYGAEYFTDDSFNTDYLVQTQTFRFGRPFPFICGDPWVCVFEDIDDLANAPNADMRGYGVFLQDQAFLTDKLTATAGLRYAKSEVDPKSTPGWDVSRLGFDDDAVVGSLSLTYGITDSLNLVGSYATAFRAPNMVELYFNGPTPEGQGFQLLNVDLASEESENLDLGFKFRSANAFFEAIYFDTEIDKAIIQHTLTEDEIAALPADVRDDIPGTASFVVQQRNAEVLTIDGIELAGGYRLENGISIGANYTHLTGKSESGGDPTGDTYSDKVAGYFRYDDPKGRFRLEYRLRHNGEQDTLLDETGAALYPIGTVLPSFTVHTLSAAVDLFETDSQTHTLGLIVENLSDELYSEFSNATFFRPQPKRSFVVTYNWRF